MRLFLRTWSPKRRFHTKMWSCYHVTSLVLHSACFLSFYVPFLVPFRSVLFRSSVEHYVLVPCFHCIIVFSCHVVCSFPWCRIHFPSVMSHGVDKFSTMYRHLSCVLIVSILGSLGISPDIPRYPRYRYPTRYQSNIPWFTMTYPPL